MNNVIFEHGLNQYKLVLEVTDQFNDYRQHCYVAQLKLYTMDNILIESENYLFPVSFNRFNNVSSAYNHFLYHLQSNHVPSELAYHLYLKSLK